jgi:hypothetical protein
MSRKIQYQKTSPQYNYGNNNHKWKVIFDIVTVVIIVIFVIWVGIRVYQGVNPK